MDTFLFVLQVILQIITIWIMLTSDLGDKGNHHDTEEPPDKGQEPASSSEE